MSSINESVTSTESGLVETGRWFNLGDKLRFKKQELTVMSSIARLTEGLMSYEYEVGPEQGVRENLILNEKLTGAALEGKVLEIAKDTVRVHLDVDGKQEKHEASWIPYSSVYTAEGSSGLHLMPEIGDAIQVYFSNAREESAVAISSVRKGGQESAKMADSSVKYWGTPYGKELKFGASDLTLTATEGSLFISLKDSQGITIESDKGMKISSKKDMKWTSEQKIDMEAKEALHLLCGRSSIIMDGDTDIRGSDVQLIGLTKFPVFIEDLEPVPEAPFITEVGAGSGQPSKTSAVMNPPTNGEQTSLSLAGMIPMFGMTGALANVALAGNTQAAAQSALASVPTGISGLNPILQQKLSKQAAWTNKLSGDFISMNPDIKERFYENANKPWLRSTESPYDRRKREREATLTKNKFWRPILDYTVVPFADTVDYVMEETTPGLFVNRMSYSAASMFGPTGSSEPTTRNKTADKVADVVGGIGSMFMNPSGVGVQGQSMWNVTNKATAFVTNSKAGAFFQSKISQLLGNSKIAQNVTKGVVTGTTAGATQSVLYSMLQGKSSGKELLQALLSGGVLGAGFGALGGIFGTLLGKLLGRLNLGKVFTDARQLVSNWTKGKEISKLKQSMKKGIIEESPVVRAGDVDFKLWEEMRASGQIRMGSNGQRHIGVRELKQFKKEINGKGIKVIIDKKGNMLPDDVAAGFDPYTGGIILRRDPTYLGVIHESYHAKQWTQLGKENYLKQSRLEREEYVYNEILKNKDKFSEGEVLYSMRYIYKVRFGEWPPQNWKEFTN
ncbi:MAG TPA: zincin-like metallopeptidase toxin domain-containing protein [Paenibacillus sp.]|jgi:hypothetical protein